MMSFLESFGQHAYIMSQIKTTHTQDHPPHVYKFGRDVIGNEINTTKYVRLLLYYVSRLPV